MVLPAGGSDEVTSESKSTGIVVVVGFADIVVYTTIGKDVTGYEVVGARSGIEDRTTECVLDRLGGSGGGSTELEDSACTDSAFSLPSTGAVS